MFGTVYFMRPKPDAEAAIKDLMNREEMERMTPAGFVASYLFRARAGGLIGVAVFDSEASYRKNADDPEQDRWYRRLRELLEADPEWYDGDVLTSFFQPSAVR